MQAIFHQLFSAAAPELHQKMWKYTLLALAELHAALSSELSVPEEK